MTEAPPTGPTWPRRTATAAILLLTAAGVGYGYVYPAWRPPETPSTHRASRSFSRLVDWIRIDRIDVAASPSSGSIHVNLDLHVTLHDTPQNRPRRPVAACPFAKSYHHYESPDQLFDEFQYHTTGISYGPLHHLPTSNVAGTVSMPGYCPLGTTQFRIQVWFDDDTIRTAPAEFLVDVQNQTATRLTP